MLSQKRHKKEKYYKLAFISVKKKKDLSNCTSMVRFYASINSNKIFITQLVYEEQHSEFRSP